MTSGIAANLDPGKAASEADSLTVRLTFPAAERNSLKPKDIFGTGEELGATASWVATFNTGQGSKSKLNERA
ncbi:MAG TPA: hypothetical protein VF778_14260 [Xanthobacteraceae bacterium]